MKADKINVVVKDNTDIAALSHPFRILQDDHVKIVRKMLEDEEKIPPFM